MIRVTIDLVPGGDERRKRTLHVIEIWNDLVGTLSDQRYGNYGYAIGRKGALEPRKQGATKVGRLLRFNRRNRNAVALLQEVLNVAYPPRRKGKGTW